MYAKIFGRIVESSLMEEPIEVRYTFVFMLAIADPEGYVIGTDVAIARRLNMPVDEFQSALEVLRQPDSNSNSKEYDGRRVIDSDIERGYKMVNYLTYRDLRDAEGRREYMKGYMRRKRAAVNDVNSVNSVNSPLAVLAQEEELSNISREIAVDFNTFWSLYPKKVDKKDAKRAFEKHECSRKMGEIIPALVAQKRLEQWQDKTFVPDPTTWINGHRWEDEIDTEEKHRSAC